MPYLGTAAGMDRLRQELERTPAPSPAWARTWRVLPDGRVPAIIAWLLGDRASRGQAGHARNGPLATAWRSRAGSPEAAVVGARTPLASARVLHRQVPDQSPGDQGDPRCLRHQAPGQLAPTRPGSPWTHSRREDNQGHDRYR